MIHPDDASSMLDQLEQLGRSLDILVRYEPLGDEDDLGPTESGLCFLKGDQILLVDNRLSPVAKCRVLANAFKHFDLTQVFITPALRRLIEGSVGDF